LQLFKLTTDFHIHELWAESEEVEGDKTTEEIQNKPLRKVLNQFKVMLFYNGPDAILSAKILLVSCCCRLLSNHSYFRGHSLFLLAT